MKKLILTLLTLINSIAFAGGISGGGGNGRVSTDEDIQKILADGARGFRGGLKTLMFTLRKVSEENSNHYFADPKTLFLVHRLANNPGTNSLADYGTALKFEVKKQGCSYNQKLKETHDASVNFRNGSWVVCFSSSRLKKYPANTLYSEMLTLTLHEISHTIGYSEKEAQLVQNFVNDVISSSCWVTVWASGSQNSNHVYRFNTMIRQGSWDFAYPVGELPRVTVGIAKGDHSQETNFGYLDHQKTIKLSIENKSFTFPVQSFDGSIFVSTIRWKDQEDLSLKTPFLSATDVSGEIVFNGEKLIVDSNAIHIGEGCFLTRRLQ